MTAIPIINVGQKLERDKKVNPPASPDRTPIPVRAQREEIPLADLFSVCPPQFSATQRMDPFWDGIWASGSSEASWISQALAARQINGGLGSLPANYQMTRESALAKISSRFKWKTKLGVLGALDTWRTLSGEQLAAMVGDPSLASTRSNITASLFCADVIDVGVFHNMLIPAEKRDRANLFRSSRTTAFVNDLEPMMTYPEWVSVTGGYPFQPGGQYDRHNLLASELGLRVAEFCDVGSVIGEKHTTVDLLAGAGMGLSVPDPDRRRADLAVLRPDGMRIAIEVTASLSANFVKKVRRWAEILQERPFDVSGLTVLFVVAAPPEREASRGYRERGQVFRAVAKAVEEFPGSPGDRTADRMGVVAWRDWFPSKGTASPDFETMRAYFPTGPHHDLWRQADLLGSNSLRLSPRNPDALEAAVYQSSLLLGVPHWLRDVSRSAQVWPVLLERAGITHIPTSPLAYPDTAKGRMLGEGVGAVTATQPPPRLLIA